MSEPIYNEEGHSNEEKESDPKKAFENWWDYEGRYANPGVKPLVRKAWLAALWWKGGQDYAKRCE